ncbi:Protein auxin RESPONSE 4 [Melia azedarach]|uniref:Protein auxin RESPONSE 4 n=1 Tax=Melia azedarach TaxID=155640 RepID=A0ACC1Y8B4_MELAZ|nr:Protein auxin RESPONSE 4 [Melia azedarach]
MAIIAEEPDKEPQQQQQQEEKPKPKPNSKTRKPQYANPFFFWFYLIVFVSVITLLFVSFSAQDKNPRSWFLSLSNSLRQHYSKGHVIKVQTSPHRSPIELFTFQNAAESTEGVFIVHGLGLSSFAFREMAEYLGSKQIHVTAIDLPGNGFSDRSTEEIERRSDGVLQRFRDVYGLIQEKGFFWAFDQIVDTGEIPYEEIMKARVSERKSDKVIDLGSEEFGRVLGQVIDTFSLAPVHLVLHDSALAMSANWIAENSGLVKSITLIDTGLKPALPLCVLNYPLIRDLFLGYPFAYQYLIRSCCMKSLGSFDVEGNRMLLKGRDQGIAVSEMGKKLNHSFDIGEWGSLDVLKGVPMQLLWSGGWSKEWSEEGSRVADALPQAKFVKHSGGRWPQVDTAGELAEHVAEFVSSLPKTVRQFEEEVIPEHIQKMLDEAKSSGHHHDHRHSHGHGHDHQDGHAHAAGYMDAYGLGDAWGQ